MNKQLLSYNSDWQSDPSQFLESDPHLSQLKKLQYIHRSPFLHNLPSKGIFALTGGLMTGKTTLIKQWIAKLLVENVPPQNIFFFPSEIIKDYHVLEKVLENELNSSSSKIMKYIFLDDVTDIPHWEKAVKSVVDSSGLDRVVLVLASPDRGIIETLAMHFGEKSFSQFHLYPLTFQQCISLKYQHTAVEDIDLTAEFNQYLLHGGFLPAINEVASVGLISDSTMKNYSDKLCGKFLKQGRSEVFLREILAGIIAHYSSQITWNSLSQELSINHPKTIGDYILLLESLDVAFVQYALLEKTLSPAPKKARKLIFCDPFIFHAINAWLHPGKNHFENQIKAVLAENELSSKIVEACVTSHYRLYYPTYYIKAEGEIDLVYIYDQRFWPLVVTWTNQLRAKDLQQILKYSNGKILTKAQRSGVIEHVRTEPIPQALWKLGITFR